MVCDDALAKSVNLVTITTDVNVLLAKLIKKHPAKFSRKTIAATSIGK